MKILRNNTERLTGVSLILGFFDGVHTGHRAVVESAEGKKVLLTFKQSPSEYFRDKAEYIYPRHYSYDLLGDIGVDYIVEKDFSELVDIEAEVYLKTLIEEYKPISISTGFNYSFGKNKEGTPELLKLKSEEYGYNYHCVLPCKDGERTISSTYIKELIKSGNIEKANSLLSNSYTIESTVIKGTQLGRKIGFPTANMRYPDKIVRLPYGVYKAEALGKTAMLNWGVKPTVNGKSEGLEVHILDYDGDLYGQNMQVKIIRKIRDEKKFSGVEELKSQINKDMKECLK